MPTIVFIHLGLGDLINYIPLLEKLQKKLDDSLVIPCFKRNLENAGQMLNGTNIELMPIENDDWDHVHALQAYYRFEGKRVIGIGYFSGHPFNVSRHVIIGYKEMGYDFKKLVSPSYFNKQAEKIGQVRVPSKPYAFIPEGGSTGEFKIDRKYIGAGLDIITPPQNAMLLTYADVIRDATEIHCHDTSWPWLINMLLTKGNLYFHQYVRDSGFKTEEMFIKKWEVIK